MSTEPIRRPRSLLAHLRGEYGMILVLLVLCVGISVITITDVHPNGAAAGKAFADDLIEAYGTDVRIFVAAGNAAEDIAFVTAVRDAAWGQGVTVVRALNGDPRDARAALVKVHESGEQLDFVVGNSTSASWLVFEDLASEFPRLGDVRIVKPKSYRWPSFLKTDNLINVVNNTTVFAIIGIGMTMVIITGGIDLSVGSLVALAAVLSTLLIRDVAGAKAASAAGLVWCSAVGIGVCALLGAVSGLIVLSFNTRPYVVPPFIMTLSMMMVARGLAYLVGQNETINEVPPSFAGLGVGTMFGVPNAVVLMFALYVIAHVMMTRTTVGRYIYAVGGNAEAARLSGVPVKRILLFVYTSCGALAGLGGVILASRLTSGSAQYGQMYELYVIAAVVVGGTSLTGGEGRIFGTLTGALIIAVVQNGLPHVGISGRKQELVLGLIILAAVLLDMLNKRGWHFGQSKPLA